MKKLAPIFLILAAFTLGCELLDSLKGPGSGGGSGVTASGDPREDVIAASRKFLALPFFSARMDGVGQTEIKSQVDYAAPDRYHVKYLGGTGAGMELIYVGSDSYMKTGGKWSKMPGDAKAIPNLRDSFTEEGLRTLTDVAFEKEESLDGKPALVYSYKNVTPVGDHPFTSKIWIGKDSGVPMKIFVEYSNGALKHMTVNYDTVTPVSIEAPIK
jgi:hypothetical protein